MEIPSVSEWLQDKSLLLSGGNGYIGKVLLEKLLRSCPGIDKIYLLLRPKRGRSVQERFDEILKSDLWSYSKFNYDFSKLVPITADLSVSGIEINESDKKVLQDNVSVVYHIAASVRFTEPLSEAIKINTRLTRDMLFLCKNFNKLELFVQVSTAYVNAPRPVVEEKMYPAEMDWGKAIELAETANPSELDALCEAVLGDYPNTYTFSKKMAEEVVWDHRHELPILIYRPVIVNGLRREPTPGWTDNQSGAEVIYYAAGKGVIRILGLGEDFRFNVCPGDITVNGMIAASWKVACHSKITGQPATRIVQSNFINPPLKEMIPVATEVMNTDPAPDALWKEYFICVPNMHLFLPLHLLFNVLPMFIVENIAKLAGKKVSLTKSLRIYYVLDAVFFPKFHNSYEMAHEGTIQAYNALSTEDKNIFDINILRDGETYYDIVKSSVLRYAIVSKDRQLPFKQRLAQRKRSLLLDKIARIFLLVLVVYYLGYSAVTFMQSIKLDF